MSTNLLQEIRQLGFQNDWKHIRILLHQLELQGGFKSVGYSSWQQLFLNEFHQDYFLELRCLEIESLLNIPVGTYSALDLQVFAPFNNRQIKKIWSMAQKQGVLPSKDSSKDVKVLIEASQEYISSLQSKINQLKQKLKTHSQTEEIIPKNPVKLNSTTLDLSRLPKVVRQQFYHLLSQCSVEVAVRYAQQEMKFLPNHQPNKPYESTAVH
ncbi:hypothetical protein [Laspinema olomoucense]|uniref:hypothetical protein n=1 Tax=Laspinema olomoucense TaxID=3231600 RepID=UPI0021BACCDB|nr:hypothetical protein [Laspinema sp. D3d]MCT7971280.1 hypothetical protein [Laspinema sp. D3d]